MGNRFTLVRGGRSSWVVDRYGHLVSRIHSDAKLFESKRVKGRMLIPGVYIRCVLVNCCVVQKDFYDFIDCTIIRGSYVGSSNYFSGGELTSITIEISTFGMGGVVLRSCVVRNISLLCDIRASNCLFDCCFIDGEILKSIRCGNRFAGCMLSYPIGITIPNTLVRFLCHSYCDVNVIF